MERLYPIDSTLHNVHDQHADNESIRVREMIMLGIDWHQLGRAVA